MKKIFTYGLCVCMMFGVLACAKESGIEETPRVADVTYLATSLEKSHKNLFANISKEDFDNQVETLKSKAESMSEAEYYYSLKELVASVGDAHTTISYNDSYYKHLNGLGLAVMKFEDGWHIMMLEEKNKQYLGYLLKGINDMSMDELFEESKRIISHDNETWVMSQFSNTMNFREALEYLGAVQKDGDIILQIQKDAMSEVESLSIESMNETEIFNANILRFERNAQPVTSPLGYYQAMEIDPTTFYIQYNQCKEAPDLPMAKFIEIVSEQLNKQAYSKIVIDMRYNTGGDSRIFESMIKELKELQATMGFDVYTLIGENTFSSATMNTLQVKDRLNATIVGSPSGGSVNGYGELQSFTLNNSPMVVYYSTKYFELVKDYPYDSIYPDMLIEKSFEDYVNGIDSEVASILELSYALCTQDLEVC